MSIPLPQLYILTSWYNDLSWRPFRSERTSAASFLSYYSISCYTASMMDIIGIKPSHYTAIFKTILLSFKTSDDTNQCIVISILKRTLHQSAQDKTKEDFLAYFSYLYHITFQKSIQSKTILSRAQCQFILLNLSQSSAMSANMVCKELCVTIIFHFSTMFPMNTKQI